MTPPTRTGDAMKATRTPRRKPAYHNGTAWTLFLPAFCEAFAIAWDQTPAARRAARAILATAADLLPAGCIGQLPEIIDGDAPHTHRGCDAQAWSITECLRVLGSPSPIHPPQPPERNMLGRRYSGGPITRNGSKIRGCLGPPFR